MSARRRSPGRHRLGPNTCALLALLCIAGAITVMKLTGSWLGVLLVLPGIAFGEMHNSRRDTTPRQIQHTPTYFADSLRSAKSTG